MARSLCLARGAHGNHRWSLGGHAAVLARSLGTMLLFSSLGCGSPVTQQAADDADDEASLSSWTASMSTSNYLLDISVDISMATDSFLVTAQGDGGYPAMEALYDPRGQRVLDWEDWYDGTYSLTEAFFPYYDELVFNWPVRQEDAPLETGTWVVELAGTRNNGQQYTNMDMDITVQTKADPRISDGTVHVRIVYARGLDTDAAVSSAVEEAVANWRNIWDSHGLSLEVEYDSSDLSPDLDYPGYNSSAYLAETFRSDGEQVTIIIGESLGGDTSIFGMSGGIPGPLVATDRSCVAISWLAHAGQDAVFSIDELRVFGETLAHETGHYLGLFHPVETTWSQWDSLSDTVDCQNMNTCESQLGSNNMFPYPVCTWQSCQAQDQLSDDQVGVTMYYSGTL